MREKFLWLSGFLWFLKYLNVHKKKTLSRDKINWQNNSMKSLTKMETGKNDILTRVYVPCFLLSSSSIYLLVLPFCLLSFLPELVQTSLVIALSKWICSNSYYVSRKRLHTGTVFSYVLSQYLHVFHVRRRWRNIPASWRNYWQRNTLARHSI